MIDIKNIDKHELEEELLKLGGKKFNAKQVFDWVYKKRAGSFEIMSNLQKPFREKLKEFFYFMRLECAKKQISRDGSIKYLFKLEDGNLIESVLIKHENRLTVCISTQAGCSYGCPMCATGKEGLKRNLKTSEILEQYLFIEKEEGVYIDNIVFMGMGEPLANYKNFIKAVMIFEDKEGLDLSYRRITVSTCGLVPQIEELIKDDIKINLSVSLHSASDKMRSEMVPVNKKYNLQLLKEVCEKYYKHFSLPVTFEYAMINGKNDGIKDCELLVDYIKKLQAQSKVNLIPYNSVKEEKFQKSTFENIALWKKKLEESDITVTIRSERGADIDAACGQLAGRE